MPVAWCVAKAYNLKTQDKSTRVNASLHKRLRELINKFEGEKRQLKSNVNKKKITIAVVLILMMASVIFMEKSMTVQAQTNVQDGGSRPLPAGVTPDATFDTLAHMSFRPNVLGVGQELLVNMWLQPPVHVSRYFKDAFTITFTKPDGTKDVVGPLSSYMGDSTAWIDYYPDQVGVWTIKFDFAGAYFPAGNYTSYAAFAGNLSAPLSSYYKPSSDGPRNFTVQTAREVLSATAATDRLLDTTCIN